MIDQIFDRAYQDGRVEMNAALSTGLRGVSQAVRNAFLVLNRIEYDAPWQDRPRKARMH